MGVEIDEIVDALAPADRVARLLQHAGIRRHVERDLVAGLLLVAVDDRLEPAKGHHSCSAPELDVPPGRLTPVERTIVEHVHDC